MEELEPKVCASMRDVRVLGRTPGDVLPHYLLRPQVLHVLSPILRDHPHLCPRSRAESDGPFGALFHQKKK